MKKTIYDTTYLGNGVNADYYPSGDFGLKQGTHEITLDNETAQELLLYIQDTWEKEQEMLEEKDRKSREEFEKEQQDEDSIKI